MNITTIPLAVAAFLALGIFLGACQSVDESAQLAGDEAVAATASDSSDSDGETAAKKAAVVEPGGARLWAETCARCHNYRRPRSRTDAQWEIIVRHMRVRANLPGDEAREILRFLKAAN